MLSHADLCVLALTYLLDTREKSAIEKPVGDAVCNHAFVSIKDSNVIF